MATTPNRTPEQVTREIEAEREQLATAVTNLRDELSVKSLLKSQSAKIAFATAAIVGYKVAKALARRHARVQAVEIGLGHERFSVGRFTLLERD